MRHAIRTFLLSLILAAGVCPANAQQLPSAPPNDVGLSSFRLERIDQMVRGFVESGKLAGATTLVARHGKVAHLQSYGVMDLDTNEPLHEDAIFRIASMSKPIVSVAAMILLEEGMLQLGDPVSKFIPELAGLKVYRDGGPMAWVDADREMIVQDLLRHTSGLTYGNDETHEVGKMYFDAAVLDPERPLRDLIDQLSELPLVATPGERWEYSVSTDVLGYLVQLVSEQPVEAFIRDRILDPLGMNDTGFFVPEEKQSRFTSLHALSDRSALVVTAKPGADKWSSEPTLIEPGGGMVSTVQDYFRFAQMLLDGGEYEGVRILSPTTVALMTMNHVPPNAMPLRLDPPWDWMVNGCGFGLGFRVILDPVAAQTAASAGSLGWFGLYDTFFLIDPEEELIGIMMAQFNPLSEHPEAPVLPYPGVREFQSLMYQAIVR